MPVSTRWTFTFLAIGFILAPLSADERSDAISLQKAAAQKKLEAARLKLTAVETEDLLLYVPVPADRIKAVAEPIQKGYTTAAKVLRYEKKVPPWTGKLAVFVVAGSRSYKDFILDALNQLPDSGEQATMDLRNDTPYLVVGFDNEKGTESQIVGETSLQVAGVLLSRKAGVGRSSIPFSMPDWLRKGFGRAVLLRMDGSANRLMEHRGRVRSLYSRTRGLAFQTAVVWGDKTIPQSELLATSLVEYLTFGPAAEKFPAFLAGFRPQDENAAPPTTNAVLSGMEWKVEDLEAGWRKWVVTGK
jgi:hypothetical protein